jgi:hypothetical protein
MLNSPPRREFFRIYTYLGPHNWGVLYEWGMGEKNAFNPILFP